MSPQRKMVRKRPGNAAHAFSAMLVRALIGSTPLLLGCGGRSIETYGNATRADSAGVQIVANHAPQWPTDGGWRIAAEPLLEVGRVEDLDEETLYDVVTLRYAGDKVLVAQPTEVRLYDATGTIVRRLGRAGEGPGEFSRVAASMACGDRVFVSELMVPRLTVFDATDRPTTISLPTPGIQGMLAPLSPLYTCTQASRLEIAADHTVWLMEYQAFRAEPVTGWTVFSSEGDWLGEVELPAAFTVHEFGEHDVLGVWRDKLGVEFVRRYSIQQ